MRAPFFELLKLESASRGFQQGEGVFSVIAKLREGLSPALLRAGAGHRDSNGQMRAPARLLCVCV